MNRSEGGQAFPDEGNYGMSMRQYYKAKAATVPASFQRNRHVTQEEGWPTQSGLNFCEGCKCGADCIGGADCEKIKEVHEKQDVFIEKWEAKRIAEWRGVYADAMIVEDEVFSKLRKKTMNEIQVSEQTTVPQLQVGMKALKAKGKTIVLQVPDDMMEKLEGTEILKMILNRLRKAGFADAIVVAQSTKVTVKNVNSVKKLKIKKLKAKKHKVERILE